MDNSTKEGYPLMEATYHRSATLLPTDPSADTIEVSFVSDLPILRSFGYEILDVNQINTDFLNSGNAPFLLDHNAATHTNQIGVVERCWVEDGIGRAIIRFSADPAKQGVINDIKTGIRTNISVGYHITGVEKEARTINSKPVFRCAFKPYEISSVSVPADPAVGTNRADDIVSHLKNETTINTIIEDNPLERNMTMEDTKELDAVRAAAKEAQQRAADITALCDKFNLQARAAEFITSDAAYSDIREQVLADVEQRTAANTVKSTPATFNIGSAEQPTYSVRRAFEAALHQDWSRAGYEREMSQEMARSGAHWDKNRFHIDMQGTRADASTTVAGSGANLVSTQFHPEKLIDVLWAKTVLDTLPVDRLTGLQGNATIPVITSKATARMVAETGALGDAENVTTALKSLAPKEMITKSRYSRQMLLQSTPNIENIVYNQLFKAIAEKLELMLFDPAVTAGAIQSVLATITGSNVVSGGTNGAAPTQTNILKLLNILGKNNITGQIDFVTNIGVVNTLGNTLKDAANTASNYIIPQLQAENYLLGRRVHTTNNVPSNLTKGSGTNLSPLIAGDWSELMVAQWGSVAVEVDTITAADTSEIIVRSYSFWDALVKREAAFTAIKDIITL